MGRASRIIWLVVGVWVLYGGLITMYDALRLQSSVPVAAHAEADETPRPVATAAIVAKDNTYIWHHYLGGVMLLVVGGACCVPALSSVLRPRLHGIAGK